MIVKKLLLMTVLSTLFFSLGYSGPFKKYAGEFAYLGAGARGSALGGAFTALTNDAASIYWNPAGLVEAKGFQVQLMHSKMFINSIKHNYIAVSNPLSQDETIGASLYYVVVNDNPDTRNAYNEILGRTEYDKVKWFNVGDYIFTLSYAKRYNEQLDWGVNVKMLYRDFEVETATGIGFDIGAKYKLDDWRFGAIIRDATSTLMAWSTGTTELIVPSLKVGAAYQFELPSYLLKIRPMVDMIFIAEKREFSAQYNIGPFSGDLLAGMEISYDDIITLRVGMDDIQRFNAGIGLNLPKISLDYAFTGYESELGNIHKISFQLYIGDILQP